MVFSIHLACHYHTIQGSVLGKKGIKIRKSKKIFSFETQFYNCQLSTVINLMRRQLDRYGDLITIVVGKYNELSASGRDGKQQGSHDVEEDWDGQPHGKDGEYRGNSDDSSQW